MKFDPEVFFKKGLEMSRKSCQWRLALAGLQLQPDIISFNAVLRSQEWPRALRLLLAMDEAVVRPDLISRRAFERSF